MRQSEDRRDESLTHCAVCRRLVVWADGEYLSAYWTVAHDGLLIRLCVACHTPADGGVYIVIPATQADRWVSLPSHTARTSPDA